MKLFLSCAVATLGCFLLPGALHAQAPVPQLVNCQGRVAVGAVNFNGSGQFKFALVNANGSTTYWSNDGTSTAGSQPAAVVTLAVTNGLYSVLLGDTSVANMAAISPSIWTNPDVRLRVWFSDGQDGFQQLTPDQRLAPNGYLADGAVTSAKLAAGAVSAANIAPGSIGAAQLAVGTLAAPVTTTGPTQNAAPNTTYAATSANETTFFLPTTANAGDAVQLRGTGPGGWVAVGGTGQRLVTPWQLKYTIAGPLMVTTITSSADGSSLVVLPRAGPSGASDYTSADFGVTWTPRSSLPAANWMAMASSADGTKLVVVGPVGVGATASVYTSVDSGVTWSAQPGAPAMNWNSVASSADGTKLVAVGGGDGQSTSIYTSTDSGVNWTAQNGAPIVSWQSVASSADGAKLVAVNYGGSGFASIYTSADSGATWAAQNGAPTSISARSSIVSSADGTNLAVLGPGGPQGSVYTSADSGVTWTAQTNAPNTILNCLASSADGSRLVVGGQSDPARNFASIYTSTDSGVTWTASIGAPTSNSMIRSVACSADAAKMAAVDDMGHIYVSGVMGGVQGSTATLQYLGNGQWAPLTY